MKKPLKVDLSGFFSEFKSIAVPKLCSLYFIEFILFYYISVKKKRYR